MDKTRSAAIERKIIEAINAALVDENVTVNRAGFRYTDEEHGQTVFKIAVIPNAADGTARDTIVDDWNDHAKTLGLNPDALGVTITLTGRPFKIAGLALRPRSTKVIITRIPDGKRFQLTIDQAQRAIIAAQPDLRDGFANTYAEMVARLEGAVR